MRVYRVELLSPEAVQVAQMMFGERTPCTDDTGACRLVRVSGEGADAVELGPVRLVRTEHVRTDDELPLHQWPVLQEVSKTTALLSVVAANWSPDCAQPLFALLLEKGFPRDKARVAVGQVAKVAGAQVELSDDEPDDRAALARCGVPDDWLGRPLDPELSELNAQFAYVIDEGKILRAYDDRRVLMSVGSFRNALADRQRTWIEGKPPKAKSKPLADWWMQHSRRRKYDRMEFLPGQVAPRGIFNTWPGFGVMPRPGDCSKFKALCRDVICDGNITHFRYLFRWMAHAVQNPGQPGQVAIVLHGGQGTGKGTFAKYFGNLFGRCFMPIGNAARITGQFTGHLHDKIVVFVDEAVFADDRKAKSLMKFLTTEEVLDGRAMFKEAEQVRNCLHLILGSNEEHVLDVSADDRRYFVLRVSDERAKDAEYFGAIAEEMRGGGLEALLHELQAEDLSNFDVRQRPETRALAAQKDHSLNPMEQWLQDLLRSGCLPATTWRGFPRRSHRPVLLKDMRDSAGTMLNSKTDRALCRFLEKWDVDTDVKMAGRSGGERYAEFPELGAMRAAWEARYPAPEWDMDAQWNAGEGDDVDEF